MKYLPIDENEERFILGCLLGDGTLSQSGKYHRLRVEQKADHKEYVDWKYVQLMKLCLTPPQFNAKHNSFRFGTVGHPELSLLKRRFYRPDRSIDPTILNKLNDLSLAIWFMDDGYKIHNTVGISSNNFADPALAQLQDWFNQLGISTSLQKDKQGKRIYIKTSSYKLFNKLVKPYVDQVQCMAYKLPKPRRDYT